MEEEREEEEGWSQEGRGGGRGCRRGEEEEGCRRGEEEQGCRRGEEEQGCGRGEEEQGCRRGEEEEGCSSWCCTICFLNCRDAWQEGRHQT